tara:strand:- start:1151 stop:2035 length:885 start_codon:yes stop_codon:yes gene_type:complete
MDASPKGRHDDEAMAVKIQSIQRGNTARAQIKAKTGFGGGRSSVGLGHVSVIIDTKKLAASQKAVEAALRSELSHLSTDLENHLEFEFLEPNNHPLHGLQDWSEQTWAKHLQEQPGLAGMLAQALFDFDADADKGKKVTPSEAQEGVEVSSGMLAGFSERNPQRLARHVKRQLKHALPMQKWRSILAFQNAAMNRLHDLDECASAFCTPRRREAQTSPRYTSRRLGQPATHDLTRLLRAAPCRVPCRRNRHLGAGAVERALPARLPARHRQARAERALQLRHRELRPLRGAPLP